MKLRIYSDLHLEFERAHTAMFSERRDEDLVILAGDIDVGDAGVRWAKKRFPHVPAVYVAGNHEFYGSTYDKVIADCREAAAGSNVHFLERDVVDIGGIRIIGCTLWTDFELYGAGRVEEAREWASTSLADFELIRQPDRSPIGTLDTVGWFSESAQWLDRTIAEADRPVLVVTHHAPTGKTIDPMYAGKISNAAFHSNAEHLLRPPVKMWVHGHTHFNTDVQVNRVRVVTNQWGYPGTNVALFRGNGLFEWGF